MSVVGKQNILVSAVHEDGRDGLVSRNALGGRNNEHARNKLYHVLARSTPGELAASLVRIAEPIKTRLLTFTSTFRSKHEEERATELFTRKSFANDLALAKNAHFAFPSNPLLSTSTRT